MNVKNEQARRAKKKLYKKIVIINITKKSMIIKNNCINIVRLVKKLYENVMLYTKRNNNRP
jgi:hypothetical protein